MGIVKYKLVNDLLNPRGNTGASANASGVAGAATMTSGWMDVRDCHMCSFNIAWTAVAATAGTITFEMTNDPAQASTSIVVPTPTIIIGNGGVLTVGTSASVVICNFSELGAYIRYKNTQSAGGAADQFSGWFIAKSQ